MKKIVFILSSLQAPRAIKRIREFQNHGYAFEVYGFTRDIGKIPDIKHTELGRIVNGSSYLGRISLIASAIHKLQKKYRDQDCLFYCFSFEIALFAFIFHCRPYIYESSDLMYTYFRQKILVRLFKRIDRVLIRKSILTVFTSQGFANYLFENNPPNNIALITNRLEPVILRHPAIDRQASTPNRKKLKISFCGMLRYRPLLVFANTVAEYFPDMSLHFYGTVANFTSTNAELLEKIKNAPNIFFHGEYKTPYDLPTIYTDTDLILCTYDTTYLNVRYAEPNKIYEAIFFRIPIIVSEGTFLAEKTIKLNIGYAINALDPESIKHFLSSLTVQSLLEKQASCATIPQNDCLNFNEDFFARIKEAIQQEK